MRKKIILLISLILPLSLFMSVPVSAQIKYSQETQKLMKEAGIEYDNSWEEISRRQAEMQKMRSLKKKDSSGQSGQDKAGAEADKNGVKYSYDEYRISGSQTAPNNGYKSGGFDELHINENYKQNVYHPTDRGFRMEGFDEFRYVDEM